MLRDWVLSTGPSGVDTSPDAARGAAEVQRPAAVADAVVGGNRGVVGHGAGVPLHGAVPGAVDGTVGITSLTTLTSPPMALAP